MVDDQKRPARCHDGSRAPQQRSSIHLDSAMQELRRYQVEVAGRKARRQVVLLEVDPLRHASGLGGGTRPTQCGGRNVDGDNSPPAFGQPYRVGALTTAEVERSGPVQLADDLGELDVDASAPHLWLGRVVLLPDSVGVIGLCMHQGLPRYEVSFTRRTDAPSSG